MNTNHKPSKTIFSTLCLPVLAAFLLSVIIANPLTAQIHLPAYDQRINPELLDAWSGGNGHNNGRWSASWITAPDADRDYGVYFFRKELTLSGKPDRFIIHVSADNRYKLYVNGTQVSVGPA